MTPLVPKMYEVYAATDILDRCTDDQFNRAMRTARVGGRNPAQRAKNAYKGSRAQRAALDLSKGQRKPTPKGDGWDPEHQIIITLSSAATKKGSK